MNKQKIAKIIRNLRLFYFFDKINFITQKIKNRKKNLKFKKEKPQVILPPDYILYESFQLDYNKYYNGGYETAIEILKLISKYKSIKNLKILDWGCGPARILRHMPSITQESCKFYGTDYNHRTIEWCKKTFTNIEFNLNQLEPKLPYSNESFDIIYGISIFTHLSEKMHYYWYNELIRTLKTNGLLIITTQGNNFKNKLTQNELKIFNEGNLVIRDKVKEGHRTFSAFQPKEFMKRLIQNETLIEHITIKPKNTNYLPQDFWIVKKETSYN